MNPQRGATRTLEPARTTHRYVPWSRAVSAPKNYRACNRQVAERNVITIEERP